MTEAAITLLGPPRIEVNDRPVEINRRKALALLAYLAVAEQRHTRDALATMLWPEASQSRARASLRSALWALNKTPLEAWLRVDAETVSLEPDASLHIDVVRFRTLLAACRSHDHPLSEVCAICLDSLSRALSLYQNDFMAGFTLPNAPAYDEWQFFQADSLRAAAATALEGLLRFHGAEGKYDRAITYARRFVALDSLHEPAHLALMELYARAGQRAAALRQFEMYRETADAELGVEPSAEMSALYGKIRSGKWPAGTEKRPARAPATKAQRPPTNLPPEPTPLVGRADALRRIGRFLEDPATRVLTIVGPGGIGKTRLALAAAAKAAATSTFPDGIYFIQLAPVDAPEAMMSHIAETVGYPLQNDGRTPARQLFDYFRRKALLLVLDNFEHLLDGATFVADLLRHAPQVTVLITSREKLNLYEEQRYVLDGLAVPEGNSASQRGDYAAARLFLQSARRRRPDFEIDPADLPHLAEICQLVEGMPLALELAAAWTEMLSVRRIATEIRQSLDFLETDVRNVPDRHRSIRAVFDASWQRLSEEEQRPYARLSLFRGGFTAEAARAVAGASLKTLARLANRSLLRPVPTRGRYEIHELLRHYAATRLRGSEATETEGRDRHAAFYCAFVQERESQLKDARQPQALAEIEAEFENAVAAWGWAAWRQQIAKLHQALVPLSLFYQWNGRLREGAAMIGLALQNLGREAAKQVEADAERTHLLLKLLMWQGKFQIAAARYERAEQSLQQAQEILDSQLLRGRNVDADRAFLLLLQSELAKIEAFSGDALALNEQSLAIYRAIDDAWGVTEALDALAARHQTLGNDELAVALQGECLAIHQRLQDPRGIAGSYSRLGHYVLFAGEIERSERYLRKSLALFREMDTRADVRHPLLILSINLVFGGKFEAAIASADACWTIHRELGMPHEPGSANVGIARARINLGQYDAARSQSESDLSRYRALNHKWYIAFALFNLGRIALAEENVALAHERLQESAALLLEMGDRPLVPDVLFCLALVHRRRGEQRQAAQAISRALKIALESAPLNPMRFELPAAALLALDAGDVERAVELYAAAGQSPYIANSRWFEQIAGEEIRRAATELPSEVRVTAQARGRARDLRSTAAELLMELEREGREA